MKIVLIAKVYKGKQCTYIVYSYDDNKTYEITEGQLKQLANKQITGEVSCVNFTFGKTNKVKFINYQIKLNIAIIRDGKIEKDVKTILGYDKDTKNIKMLDCLGNISYLDLPEYIQYRNCNTVNNEKSFRGILYLNHHIPEELLKVALNRDPITQSSDNSDPIAQSSDNSDPIVQSSDNSDPIAQSNDTEDLLKKLLFSMYPMDRITLTYSQFSIFQYRIIKIVDSNMDLSERVAICKIYKNSDKVKNTLCIIKFNDKTELCEVQIIGQSDIREKRPIYNIDSLALEYAKWRRETKFIRI